MHTSDEWGGNINDIAMSTLHLSTTREQVGSKSHEQIHGTMSDNFEEADRESETFLDSGHALRDSTSQRAHTSLNPAILANPTTEVDDKRSRREGRKSRWMNFVTFRNRRSECPILTERQPSPETEAGFFSLLTFQWMASLMQVGYARSLDLTDIWQVNPHRSVPVMRARLSASFERRMQSGDKNSLRNAIYDTFRKEFLFGGFHSFAASILQVLSPFALRYLIQFVADAYTASRGGLETPPISHGIAWVIGITLMQILQTLCFNHFLYRGMLIGGQSRAVLIALIFDKATKLSGRARVGGSSQEMPPSEIKLETEEGRRWMRKRIGRIRATKGQPGWSEGRIMNLMSMDTSRINQGSIMIHSLWTSPVSICLALALLLVNITYSALPGVALLLLVIPLLAKAVKVMLARRKAITPITDLRVTLTQEILQSVRFVKYFGWESAFLDRLDEIRKQELSRTRAMLTIRHAVTAIGTSMSTFAAMLAFITYALSGHQLTSSRVFSSLSLFGALSMPLNQLPQVLGHVTDAAHSISRIQDFLLAEEAEDPVDWDFDNENAIVLKKAKFVWEQNDGRESDNDAIDNRSTSKQSQRIEQTTKQTRDHAERHSETSGKSPIKPESSTGPAHSKDSVRYPFTLGELSLTVGHHELVAIIGIVGSGKSSLLAALAGDMRKIAGSITLGASRSFCSQSAWIQNASVKENIIFGKNKETSGSVAVNDDWYNKVLDACDLRSDMEAFPFGDMTELGERGINLSGGQRQRLDLARAIYSDAGLVLMDDPLSAVDASVGRHIMDNAICGLLKDRCRIIATHQLHILHRCDRVIYLDGGRIIADGTFVDLMVHSLPFQKIMANVAHEDDRDLFEKVGEQVDELEGKQKTMTQSQAALMQVEERPVRSVSWSVYAAYVRASGTMLNIPLVLFLLVASQGAGVSTGLWLSWWTSNKFGYSLGIYIGTFVALGITQTCLAFTFYVHLTNSGTRASRTMLQAAVRHVLRAPVSFFDTTPLGRITNRFSKDVDVMDNNLSDSLRNFLIFSGQIVAVFILTLVYLPYFAAALAILAFMVLFSFRYYRASARELKRHEALLRSHIFARFGEAISGIPTIRAYGLQQKFTALVSTAVDEMDGAYFLTFANQCWLSVRLDAAGNAMVLTVGILVVTSRLSVNPSVSGLLLSSIISVVQYLQYSVRQLAEVENNMNSTERLHHYAVNLEQEAALYTPGVRPTWPEMGEIVFDNVHMKYREDLPMILHGLTIQIKPGERVGIVGRTGAGKSSILSSLFRMSGLDHGTITIDGVNIANIGLHDLRSRLSIIPQEPTLFKGTIRSNLDPFNKYADVQLWSALRQAGLAAEDQDPGNTTGHRIHLDAPVEEKGTNYSLGQRQMIAVARALVRDARIIVCDEATSSVDFETDRKIQQAILRGFKGKTLLCIAHRLRTILTYDRILVMDAGKIAEVDTPLALWEKRGIFRLMCDRSGIGYRDFIEDEERQS